MIQLPPGIWDLISIRHEMEALKMATGRTNSPNRSQTPNNGTAVQVSRCSLLGAGLVVPIIVPRFVLGGPGNRPPSDKQRVAGVGVGGMGQN